MDSLLQNTIQEYRTSHQYSNIMIRGQGLTSYVYSSKWKEGVIGALYKYDSVEVEKGGKALIRNKYSRRDFCDD